MYYPSEEIQSQFCALFLYDYDIPKAIEIVKYFRNLLNQCELPNITFNAIRNFCHRLKEMRSKLLHLSEVGIYSKYHKVASFDTCPNVDDPLEFFSTLCYELEVFKDDVTIDEMYNYFEEEAMFIVLFSKVNFTQIVHVVVLCEQIQKNCKFFNPIRKIASNSCVCKMYETNGDCFCDFNKDFLEKCSLKQQNKAAFDEVDSL